MNKLLWYYLLIISTSFSCSNKTNIDFDLNRDNYKKIVDCVYQKYMQIFSISKSNNSISVFDANRIKNEFCLEVIQKIKDHKIDIITLDRDSSVTILFSTIPGIKSKQIGLLYSNNNYNKFSDYYGDFKIVEKKEDKWYLIERIISLAN